jgi:hypothetical protein
MSEDKKSEVHPIVKRALEMALETFGQIVIDDYAVEELQELLKQYYGKPDLINAVVSLINLAGALEKEGSPAAAIQIIKVFTIASDALKEVKKKTKPE